MLVINYKGNTPQQRFYTVGVKDNNNANVVKFILNKEQEDVSLENLNAYLKLVNKELEYVDKIVLEDRVITEETVEYTWVIKSKSTQYRNLLMQLQFQSDDDEQVVWQTLIAELELNETIKADETINDKYPTELAQLEKKINDFDKEFDSKQDKLVSGQNIKTINGESVLGEGDIQTGGGSVPSFRPHVEDDTLVFTNEEYEEIFTKLYPKIAIVDEGDDYVYYYELTDTDPQIEDQMNSLTYTRAGGGTNSLTATVLLFHYSIDDDEYTCREVQSYIDTTQVVKTTGNQEIRGTKTFKDKIKFFGYNDHYPLILGKLTEDSIAFYDEDDNTQWFTFGETLALTRAISPYESLVYNIGTSSKRYATMYCDVVDVKSEVIAKTIKRGAGNTQTMIGLGVGVVNFGRVADDDVVVMGISSITKAFYPTIANYDLGKSDYPFHDIYIDGVISDGTNETNPTKINNNFAPTYNSASTYNVGDHVIYQGRMYECNTAITVAEAWDDAHWDMIDVDTLVSRSSPITTPTIVVALAQVVSAGQDSYTASPYIRFTPTAEQATILADETINTIKLDLTALGNTAPAPYVWIKRNTQVQVNGNTAYQFSCGGEQYWYDNYLTDIAIKDIGNGALVYVPALSTCDITLASISMPDYHLAMGKLNSLVFTTTTGSEAITYDNQTLNVATRDTDQTISGRKWFTGNNKVAISNTGWQYAWYLNYNARKLELKEGSESNPTTHYVFGRTDGFYPATNEGKDLGTSSYKWNNIYGVKLIISTITDGLGNDITPEQVYYLGKSIQGLAQPVAVNLSNGDTLTDQPTIYMMSQHLPVMINSSMCYFLTEDTNYYVYTSHYFDSSNLDVVPYKIIINKSTFAVVIARI